MKLTVKNAAGLKLPSGKSDHIEFDSEVPGFGLRLRDGGKRVWIFQYKIGQQQRRMTFGHYPAMDVPAARTRAEELHAEAKLGRDPAGDKAERQARMGETFEACMNLYLDRRRKDPKLRPSSLRAIERHLTRNLKALHRLRIDQVDRRAIALELARIGASAPIQANRTGANLGTFLTWCVKEGFIESNPAAVVNKNPERSRNRVLINVDEEAGKIDATELKLIWKALGDDDYGAIIKLLILTGARAGEVAGLERSEIDLARNLISIPGDRTKNHRPHTIPLSAAARAIIEARPQRVGADGKMRNFLFGAGEGPFSGWSKSKERLDEKLTEAAGEPLPHWTLHDLRRTCATGMAEIGVGPHIIEAILNHVSGVRLLHAQIAGHRAGVAGIYNRASYETEKRNALNLWAEHVLAWVEGRESNFTVLRRA
jgi:integrase